MHSHSSDAVPTALTPPLPRYPGCERAKAPAARYMRLRDTVAPSECRLPKGLPRGAQMLIHKSRSGFPFTEDVLDTGRSSVPVVKRASLQAKIHVTQSQPPKVMCSTWQKGLPPNIRHMLWDCPGLQDARNHQTLQNSGGVDRSACSAAQGCPPCGTSPRRLARPAVVVPGGSQERLIFGGDVHPRSSALHPTHLLEPQHSTHRQPILNEFYSFIHYWAPRIGGVQNPTSRRVSGSQNHFFRIQRAKA